MTVQVNLRTPVAPNHAAFRVNSRDDVTTSISIINVIRGTVFKTVCGRSFIFPDEDL
jgi:hypothetical protein